MNASPTRVSPPSPRPAARAARLVWLVAAAAMVLIGILGASAAASGANASALDAIASVSLVVALAAFVLSGALIVARQPGNVVGWLLLIPGLTAPLASLATNWLAGLDPAPQDVDPLLWLLLWVTSWAWLMLIFPIFHLLLTFPDGRLPSPRWRWAVVLEVGMIATMLVLAALIDDLGVLVDDEVVWSVPNPIGFIDGSLWESSFGLAWNVGLVLITVSAVAAVVVRFRRGSTVERQQLKWPLVAVAFFGLVYGVGAGMGGGLGSTLANLLFGISLAAIPVSVAVAVLRYRLFEIDRIISRTIAWVLVTATLGAVFGGVIVGLQAALAPFTNSNTLAVAASTLAVATLFQPLRVGTQRFVDRRFDRARVDAQQTIDAFGARLRDEVDLDALHGRLLAAADAGVQPAGIALWLRGRHGETV